jgi:dihydropteroate synthase
MQRATVPEVRLGGKSLNWSRTYIMGIVNVTPDSFSDGGQFFSTDAAVAHGLALAEAGADILDIGGESTRPGADPVPASEEKARVLPVIEKLASKVAVPISIDTYKAEVAAAAVDSGAGCINDVSGLTLDPETAHVAAEKGVPMVLGHIRGDPRTMQQQTDYEDCLAEVIVRLKRSVEAAAAAGVDADCVIVDPGIGFGKTPEQNLELMLGAGRIRKETGRAVLVGPSRKSFIGVFADAPTGDRLYGTLAAVTVSVVSGADIVRVHDVRPARQAIALADAFRKAAGGAGETG